MTTELTKAAQQALEQLEFLNACYPHKTATDAADALRRALTQSPAAQTEREAFEAWYYENVNRAVLPDYLPKLETYSSATVANLFSSWKAGAAWLRASLPATQQATPEPVVHKCRHCGVTTIEDEDGVTMHGLPAPERPIIFDPSADVPIPATPEPVGWTDADADAARLAMELECLLLDTKDTAAVSRWWKSANEALDLHRARLAAAQAKGAGHA